MNLEQLRQRNGLETLYIHSPGATSASVQIWFRAGSALEKKSEMGIAHFLEHMFFKGTKKRPGAMIAHDVESFGGEINAFSMGLSNGMSLNALRSGFITGQNPIISLSVSIRVFLNALRSGRVTGQNYVLLMV